MIDSQFIEVGIGLVFIFLLMSIFVSAINEAWVAFFSQRGKQLKDSITSALNDSSNQNWAELFYDRPVIDALKYSEKRLPSYIGSEVFAKGLIEVVAELARKDNYEIKGETWTYVQSEEIIYSIPKFKEGLQKMEKSETRTMLETLLDNSGGKIELLEKNVQVWFEKYMERVSGWYKRKIQWRLFIFAIVVTVIMNVDTIHISKKLWTDTVLREALANAATSYDLEKDSTIPSSKDSTFEQKVEHIKEGFNRMGMLNLPIGWGCNASQRQALRTAYLADPGFFNGVVYYWNLLGCFIGSITFPMVCGWIFTAIAVCFGAPYWYDILNRLLAMRKKKQEQS